MLEPHFGLTPRGYGDMVSDCRWPPDTGVCSNLNIVTNPHRSQHEVVVTNIMCPDFHAVTYNAVVAYLDQFRMEIVKLDSWSDCCILTNLNANGPV